MKNAVVFSLIFSLATSAFSSNLWAADEPKAKVEYKTGHMFMLHNSALSTNPEYVRQIINQYNIIDSDELVSVTPLVSTDDHGFLESLKSRFNVSKKRKAKIEDSVRRLAWVFQLAKNGYFDAAESEFAEVLNFLIEFNIDLYQSSQDADLASRQTKEFVDLIVDFTSQHIAGLTLAEHKRLGIMTSKIQEQLSTPAALQNVKSAFKSRFHSGNADGSATLLYFFGLIGVEAYAIYSYRNGAFGQFVENSGPIIIIPLFVGAIGAIFTNLAVSYKIRKELNWYNRAFSKVIKPDTLNALYESCRRLLQ